VAFPYPKAFNLQGKNTLSLFWLAGEEEKGFMIVMTMAYTYITVILANLNLARSVNYDRKARCKLKGTFMIINYNRETFIVEATGLLGSIDIYF